MLYTWLNYVFDSLTLYTSWRIEEALLYIWLAVTSAQIHIESQASYLILWFYHILDWFRHIYHCEVDRFFTSYYK